MDLFIETPRQASERLERERRSHEAWLSSLERSHEEERQRGTGAVGRERERGEPIPVPREAPMPPAHEAYSVAQEAYREELAFDRRRARSRKVRSVLRVAGLIIGIPLLLVAVFIGSYICTCILNGATPEEIGELLAGMVTRVTQFFAQLE